MLFLCALGMGQRVERGHVGRRRVLCKAAWEEEEEEQKEGETPGHGGDGGVLRGRRHGGDLSSDGQGGPQLGKRGDIRFHTCLQRKNAIFHPSNFHFNFRHLEAFPPLSIQ